MSIKNVLAKAPRQQPTLNLSIKDLPDIKDWKVGGKYTIQLEVEQTSAEKGDSYYDDSDKELRARFKVLKAKACED